MSSRWISVPPPTRGSSPSPVRTQAARRRPRPWGWRLLDARAAPAPPDERARRPRRAVDVARAGDLGAAQAWTSRGLSARSARTSRACAAASPPPNDTRDAVVVLLDRRAAVRTPRRAPRAPPPCSAPRRRSTLTVATSHYEVAKAPPAPRRPPRARRRRRRRAPRAVLSPARRTPRSVRHRARPTYRRGHLRRRQRARRRGGLGWRRRAPTAAEAAMAPTGRGADRPRRRRGPRRARPPRWSASAECKRCAPPRPGGAGQARGTCTRTSRAAARAQRALRARLAVERRGGARSSRARCRGAERPGGGGDALSLEPPRRRADASARLGRDAATGDAVPGRPPAAAARPRGRAVARCDDASELRQPSTASRRARGSRARVGGDGGRMGGTECGNVDLDELAGEVVVRTAPRARRSRGCARDRGHVERKASAAR